ncbi:MULTISPECIES: ATP-binding protein [Streptomyces]|uniref:ATP-binding protein n=1 Tax=Streptomyces TaxID=1883 RepID=UPI000F74B07E|nr:ATP-binding protein [Streptomyces sp. WAC05292]RSS86248.1 ATP-binding protein [Streptomyces sp. WAC05292]
MSLPLTRRIARTALLLAAGAAPVVGAAGAASAAGLDSSLPQLGALTGPQAADSASEAVPAAPGQVADTAGALLGGLPAAQALPTGAVPAGDLAGAVPAQGLPTDALPTGSLPTDSLPLGSLPLNGLAG